MFIVYGKENCTQCKQAKQILDMKSLEYKYKSVPEDINQIDFYSLLEAFNVVPRSFPQIVKIDEDLTAYYIGGLEALVKELKK